MNLSAIQPVGPHIEGIIRFASTGSGAGFTQLNYFEVLTRLHSETTLEGTPKLGVHPICERLRAVEGNEEGKICVIPIRLIFDTPENNLCARYEAYDQDLNRLACAGDGDKGCRANFATGETGEVDCKGPDACEYANSAGIGCALHVRLKAQIEGQSDDFSVFELQSGGVNSYRTLSAKLAMMHAAFGARLRHVPLEIALYGKSSMASSFEPFYVADVRLRSGVNMREAACAAIEGAEQDANANIDFGAMEKVVTQMRTQKVLTLSDAESAMITQAPAIVDRMRLVRRPPSATEQLMAAPLSIQALVENARASVVASEAKAPEQRVSFSLVIEPMAGVFMTVANEVVSEDELVFTSGAIPAVAEGRETPPIAF